MKIQWQDEFPKEIKEAHTKPGHLYELQGGEGLWLRIADFWIVFYENGSVEVNPLLTNRSYNFLFFKGSMRIEQ